MATADSQAYVFTVIGAPVLSNARTDDITHSAFNAYVTTDQNSGTLYWTADMSATPPTATQVCLGLSHDGSAAMRNGTAMVQGATEHGPYTLGDFMPEDFVYAWFTQVDEAGNAADVVGDTAQMLEGNLTGQTESVYFGESPDPIPADHETSPARTAEVKTQNRTSVIDPG